MKILGLDSSGLVASVALVEDWELVAEFTTNYKKTHSQTLLPMLDGLRKLVELDLNTIDAIAVASGPGSFTGLRIGSATAKGLGLALDKPLVEVPTLEGLAWNLCPSDRLVCPLMDARRNQVYAAAYEYAEDQTEAGMPFDAHLRTVIGPKPVDIEEFLDELNTFGRKIVFLGDGVPVYRDVISRRCRAPFGFAPAGSNRQRAASIASLGGVYYAMGKTVTAREHVPEYLRMSQAEQEAQRKKRTEE